MVNPRYRTEGHEDGCCCNTCCGNTVSISIPKTVINYDKHCIKACRPGEKEAKNVPIHSEGLEFGVTKLAACKYFEVECTNSQIYGVMNAELCIDLTCSASVVTRDILLFDDKFVSQWAAGSQVPLCRGLAGVDVDAEFTICARTGIYPRTILAECIAIETEMHEGSIPVAVSPVPEVGNSVQVDIDLELCIAP